MSYSEGQVPRITATFKTSSGTLVDPTSVFFRYKVGNGAVTQEAYGGGIVLKESTGVYYVDIDTTGKPGKWIYRWYSTGTAACSMLKREFDVEEAEP